MNDSFQFNVFGALLIYKNINTWGVIMVQCIFIKGRLQKYAKGLIHLPDVLMVKWSGSIKLLATYHL